MNVFHKTQSLQHSNSSNLKKPKDSTVPTSTSFQSVTTSLLLSSTISIKPTNTVSRDIESEIGGYLNNKSSLEAVSVAAAASKFDPNVNHSNITTTPTKPTEIVFLVLGFFGAIACVAAAMFLIIRKKRRSVDTERLQSGKNISRIKNIPNLVIAPVVVSTIKKRTTDCDEAIIQTNSDSSNTIIDMFSTSGTLVENILPRQTPKRVSYHNDYDSQRSSWQTFVTCETTKTEDTGEKAFCRKKAGTQKWPMYKAQLADPLIAYT